MTVLFQSAVPVFRGSRLLLSFLLMSLACAASASAQQGATSPQPLSITTGTAAPAPDQIPLQQPVFAPPSNQDLNNMSIEELMQIEVSTVESASRYRQKVSEAPASVTIVTAEEIRKFGYRTLADILGSVRGFYTTYDRSYQYLGVRGFGRPGDHNTRVLLLVDGHRVNDAINDAAPLGSEFPLDVDLIERVEVTRGPGSSLYGDNAFFGVVNVITRRAKDVGGGEVSAAAGSNASYKGRLSYGSAGGGDRDILASVTGYTSDGDRLYFREFDPNYPLSDPRAANNGFADNGDYDRSRSGYAKFELAGFRFAAAYSERTKGMPTAENGADFNNPGNRNIDERGYLDLQYSARSRGGDEYTARVYYDRYEHEKDSWYTGTLNQDRAVGSWYGGEARYTTRIWNIHHLIAGGEYEIRAQQDQRNGDVGPLPAVFLDDQRSSRSGAAYVQDEITVSPGFLLYAGIRRDQVSTFGGATNPRLAAVISPIENGTVKLLYGRAFRAPTVHELYYEAPPSVVSNPALRPETIDTYELAYEQGFGKGLRASLSRYSYSIGNLITQTYDAASGTTSFRNLQKAEATGTELEVRKTWENGADGSINYAYQIAQDRSTGELLTNAPRSLARLNLSVPLVSERLWAGLEEQYLGSRRTQAGKSTPAVILTNLTLLGRTKDRRLEISFSIYNLLDESYADPVSADLFPLDTVQQDGRTVRAKLTYAF